MRSLAAVANVAATIAAIVVAAAFVYLLFFGHPPKRAADPNDPWNCSHSAPGTTVCIKDAPRLASPKP
jgi:hypothetical protein